MANRVDPPGPPVSARRLPGLPPLPGAAALGSLALTLALALAGAATFYVLKLPLPFFLGALTFCLAGSVAGLPVSALRPLSFPARAVLGFAVGAAFTPALLRQIPAMAPSLMLVIPFSILIITLGQMFFERIARFDAPTAFFAAVPGGLSDMIAMAEDAGAHQRTVTLVQSTRVVILVFAVPLWLKVTDGVELGGLVPQTIPLMQSHPADLAMLALIAIIGWRGGQWLGLAGAPIVGPMLLSALVHALGGTSAKVPFEIMSAAQIALGLWVGARFKGLTLAELRTTMIWGTAFTVILLVVTAIVALVLSRLVGVPHVSVLLAFAPGGQAELNLVALILGADLAFVALHHLVRLAAVMFYAQWVFVRRGWRGRARR